MKNYYTNKLFLEEIFTWSFARFRGNKYHLNKMYELFYGDNFFRIIYSLEKDYKIVYGTLCRYVSPNRLLSYVDASLIFLYHKYNAEYN
jgi:hypothetical protein